MVTHGGYLPPLPSRLASQLRGRLPPPPPNAGVPVFFLCLTLTRPLAQATTLERAGASDSWGLEIIFQESLFLIGVDYLKTIGSAYKGASGFGKVVYFQSTVPCASWVQTRAV